MLKPQVVAVLMVGLLAAACGSTRAAAPSLTGPGSTDVSADSSPGTEDPTGTLPSSVDATPDTLATGDTAVTVPSAQVAGLGAVAGHTIVIDPGHNSANGSHAADINKIVFVGNGSKACDTAGTAGNDGYPEHAYTFDVASRLQKLLVAAGAHVVMTRPDDAGVGPCITQRAAIGNDAHGELAVSIHADGGPATGRGFHVITPMPVPGFNDGIVAPSDRFGVLLRDRFAADTSMPTANYIAQHGIVARSDLGGLNMSKVPKVFIETGNMRNATDEAMLHDPVWRERAATSIAAAMAEFFAAK